MKRVAIAAALSLVACNSVLQFDDDAGSDAAGETSGSCVTNGCPLFSQRCEPTSATCVECLATADCPGRLVCDPDVHTCVECLQDTDCEHAGDTCILSIKQCARRCGSTTECNPTGLGDETCDLARSVPICVECAGDGDCTAESNRHSCELSWGHCVQCLTDVTCASPTPRCDQTFFKCVQCLRDADCPAAAPYCDPTHHACVSG